MRVASEKEENKEKKRGLILGILIAISILIGIVTIITRPKSSIKTSFSIIGAKNIQNEIPIKRDGIGIINLTGIISYEKGRYTAFGIETPSVVEQLTDDFQYYLEDDNTKAIVLQVDSPGGSLVACEETLKNLKDLKEKNPKPIVASFRTMAASGGYYLSMIADEIYANEATLTGSIGVISQFLNVSDLMNRYGVKMYTVKSGKNKDALSPFREPREDELEYWQKMTYEFVGQFTNVVEEGRKGKLKGQREDIFDGRVFSGIDALKVGLVDNIGTLNDAIEKAAKLANLDEEDPYIIKKPRKKTTPIEMLLSATLKTLEPKSIIPYEEIMQTKYIGVPMYIYLPNYGGGN